RTSEDSMLLALGHRDLHAKTAADPGFATRLYRAFARSLSHQMRTAQETFGHRLAVARTDPDRSVSRHCPNTASKLESMKRMLAEADRQALRNRNLGRVPEIMMAHIREEFRSFCGWLNDEIGDASPLSPELRQKLGAQVQQEILPYMLLTKNG